MSDVFRLPLRDEDRPPTLAELVACPPTEDAAAFRDAAVEAATACHDESPRKPYLERRATQAEAMLKLARRRDLEQGRRRELGPEYERCFCLSQGGRGQQVNAALMWDGGLLPIFDADGFQVLTWEEVCPCPDGLALQARCSAEAKLHLARLRAARVERVVGEAGIPLRYRLQTREGWLELVRRHRGDVGDATTKLETIAAWEELMAADEPATRCLLLLMGNYGTGKSSLASLVALEWAKRERSVLFRSVPWLAASFRAAPWRRERPEDPPTETELIAALVDVDLLVLDDLGTEALGTDVQGDRVREWLFAVIDGRLSDGRPTVVSCNLNRDELIKRYDERLVSRLVFGMQAVPLVFGDGIPNLREAIDD